MPIHFINEARLPVTYQEVEWIGSSATQYINTGYIPTINTEIETDLSWGSSQAEWGVFFGMTSNDNWRDGICGRVYSTSPTVFNPRFLNSAYEQCQITTTTDTFHKVILKKNYCTLDGTAGTLTTTYSSPYSGAIYLFCGNNGGSAWRHTSVKFKSFKISESGTLQRNFVPCYRKSDNVIGLYDLVNNQFYTNAGSGTFTKGADVAPENLSRLYIGDKLIVGGECGYNFQGQLDLKSDTFGRPFHIFHKIGNDFVSLNSDMAQYPTIYGIRVDANGNILKSNAVSSPIRYSWYPNGSLHPVNKTIFIRSEWDGGVYNYDTDNLTIGSSVMNYGSGYGNSYCVSSDGKLIAYGGNESTTSQKYIIVNGTSYGSMNDRPFGSGAGNSNNCIDDNGNIYVQLRNSTGVYKCRVNSNRALQYTKIGDAQSGYSIYNGESGDFPVLLGSGGFQIGKDGQLSSLYSRSRSRSNRRGTGIGNYVCITDNGSGYTDIYVFKTTDLSNPVYTNTISYEVEVGGYPGMNGFILSGSGRTYFLH